MAMSERLQGIKNQAIRAIDTVVTFSNPASGFIWTELYRQNRDGSTFSIETHNRGGEYGLLIYPDGTVVKAGKSSILYRKDLTGKIIDRVRVGKSSGGFLFIPQADYGKYEDELKEVLQEPPLPPLNGFGGRMVVGGSRCATILSKRPHEQLLAKLANNI